MEIHRVRNIIGLDGFHQIVCHFGRAVYRNIGKADAAASVYQIILRFGIVVAAVAPGPHPCGAITHLCVHIRVKQPERDIHALDFINVVLILENLRQQPFAGQVPHQSGLRRLFIQLEGNHKIRLQRAGKLSGHHHGIPAEGAGSGRRVFIPHDLAAAGVANIGAQTVGFALLPCTARGCFPFHAVGCVAVQLGIVERKGFHIKLGAAIGAFHLLRAAVEFDSAAAARAFIFLQCIQNDSSLSDIDSVSYVSGTVGAYFSARR